MLAEPWATYRKSWSGGRPPYWTEQLEDLQKRKASAYRQGRQWDITEAWEEHKRLEKAMKRAVGWERRRLERTIRELMQRAPLGTKAQELLKKRENG